MTRKIVRFQYHGFNPYFKNRQEMFDLLEQPFDCIAESYKFLPQMMVEVLEAKSKIVSETVRYKEKTLKEYEKIKLVSIWLKNATWHFECKGKDWWFDMMVANPLLYYFVYSYTRFDKFEAQILRIEQGYTDTSQSLNDEFKVLGYSQVIETALAELKAKMGL